MKPRFAAPLGLLLTGVLAVTCARAAAPTTFVASSRLDSNTASNCGPLSPCRTFRAPLSVANPGGEVVVLDSTDYGSASVMQSVSIAAPAGIYAGVTYPGAIGFAVSGTNMSVKRQVCRCGCRPTAENVRLISRINVGKRHESVSVEVTRSNRPSDSAKRHSTFKEIIMKLKSELKRIEEELKVSPRHEVERDGDADVFELSLDELGYVAGGSLHNIKIEGVD